VFAAYGKIKYSKEVTRLFQTGTVNQRFNYYIAGIKDINDTCPGAIMGLNPD